MTSARQQPLLSRRDALGRLASGFPLLALGGLLQRESIASDAAAGGAVSSKTPRAKRVIFLCMGGGPSHVDLFDPKPKLREFEGRDIPLKLPPDLRDAELRCAPCPWTFRQCGQSGAVISELLPQLQTVADDLCIIRSCRADSIEHTAGLRQMFTGATIDSRPSIGAWLLYGLGSESESLPGFVYIGQQNNAKGPMLYSSSFLPAAYQGTRIEDPSQPIHDLAPPDGPDASRQRIAAISKLNRAHLRGREEDSRLEARIAAYELAFRMQTAAPEAFDLSRESAATRELYGLNDRVTREYGSQCLLARRLAERGVRFVVANVDNKWDHHANMLLHEKVARETDRPVAALIHDLKQRGLLDDTLVLWGGEFGRTPTAQGTGRDHHPHGFTMWMAGGGVKPGITYGSTDEFGWYAEENPVHVHDLHATILHLLGISHEQLTYRYSGRDFRLTDVHGKVVHDLLA